MLENNCIYNTLIEQEHNLLVEINPQYFVNPLNYEIWKNALLCFKESNKCDVESVKTFIANQNYKQDKLTQMLNKIDMLTKQTYILPENVTKGMYNNYCRYKHNELKKILLNDKLTTESKNNKIIQIQKEITENNISQTLIPLQDKIEQYIKQMHEGVQTRFNEQSIPCEIGWTRKIFNSYIRPCPIIIAGAPAYNKTAFVINLMYYFNSLQLPGMYFTWEDSIDVLRNKYIAIKNDIQLNNIMDCNFSEVQKKKVYDMTQKTNRIWVTDEPYSILQFRREIDKQMALRNYRWIILDYIELFRYNHKDEPKELRKIMNEIVRICNKYMIPVFILSQINYDRQAVVEPNLRDLFGSSGLEKNARQVIMLGGERELPEREVYIRKNSYGACFHTQIEFNQLSGRIL